MNGRHRLRNVPNPDCNLRNVSQSAIRNPKSEIEKGGTINDYFN
ncbi:MAG: hypothetical protein QME81_02015 [bacterium]|nr:hypothetical protein [bacterium]